MGISTDTAAQSVAHSIASAGRILAVTHANPDGDAIGSLIAFGHMAVALGKEIRLYCESPIPAHLAWLKSPVPILQRLEELCGWRPDRVLFLDCADEYRAGEAMAALVTRRDEADPDRADVICIDHHIANPLFGDVNWVDPGMGATGMMVALLAKEMGCALKGDLGEAIYLAIVSDTGSFTYGNTSALALQLAAEIVGNGLSLAEFTTKFENNWTLNRMHLWGALMREVKLLCSGNVVVSVVTDEHLARYNTERADLEGYASWLRRLKGSRVVILARSSAKGSKISLRSMGDVDVQAIAARFGGGGHKAAAGVDMRQPPREAATLILEAVCGEIGEDAACLNFQPGPCAR